MSIAAAAAETMPGPDPSAAADVVIAGGGLVGLTLAAALATAGMTVAVVDREDPAVAADGAFDGRGSAIAHGSANVLRGIGLWRRLADDAEPILDIRVTDGDSRLFLHYDHRDVGRDPFGYIIENRAIRRALYAHVATLPTLRLIAPATLTGLRVRDGAVTASLAGGGALRARLAIAADGHDSPLRAAAGIRTTTWRYPQTGIVCAIRHERPHGGIAHERFLPAGPFAVLPLRTVDGVHRSSLVWTERVELAPMMMRLTDAAFSAEIARRFGGSLGALAVEGRRWAYPLGLLMAEDYVGQRLALVGDAAHAIHPIAGQGLNLGLRDVAALAEAVTDAWRLGLDIGGAGVLARYQGWRRFDNLVLMAVTDGLNRLFSNDLPPLRWARDFGLALVNELPPLKRLFMRHAMGVVGDLPRLVRGEAL